MRLPPLRYRLWTVVAVLLAAQLFVRPWMTPSMFTPDFVLAAVLMIAMLTRPGAGAIAGVVVGILSDAVAPTAFGAGAFSLTVVAFAAGWLKAVVFADNPLMTAVFVFAASWLRDLLEVAASGALRGSGVLSQLLVYSPAAALGTAAAAVLTLVVFRGWLRAAPAL